MVEKGPTHPINNLAFVTKALEFVMDREDHRRYLADDFPLGPLGRIGFTFSHLVDPEKLRHAINIYSSYNHGKYILTCVFPRNINPENYHSNDTQVNLADNPTPALTWEEEEQMEQDAVASGMLQTWVRRGFEEGAIERGINLEWHFTNGPVAKRADKLK